MAEAIENKRRTIWTTPIRDLVRGRVTGRLNWKAKLAAAGLADQTSLLIARVVKRTRLWKLEKAAVAEELIAHFQDGVAAGVATDELIASFGDERTAAKLMRRGKKRNRPVVWHLWIFAVRVTFVLLSIYAFFLMRFCFGQPSPRVDYLTKLDEQVTDTPPDDRAWPIWRQAILGLSQAAPSGRQFSSVVFPHDDKVDWPAQIRWLDDHAAGLELARHAAAKSSLGFIYGPAGSQADPELGFNFNNNNEPRGPLIEVLLPHLGDMRWIAKILALDVKRAGELHDDARVMADLHAMMGLSRQLHNSHGFVVSDLVALGIDNIVVESIQLMLSHSPSTLSQNQWIEIAHTLAAPKLAADLIDIGQERDFFADAVQRIYTDNGRGDGRLTLKGMASMRVVPQKTLSNDPASWPIVEAVVPMIGASRADLMQKYNQLFGQTEANYHQPIRRVDWSTTNAEIERIKNSPVESVRYLLLTNLYPYLSAAQWACEKYLGERDGTVAAISLELFHRESGHYPATLEELVPRFLPEIPADRFTGDPVKYRLFDGKPLIYSVGSNRIDDGGKPVTVQTGRYRSAADWWVKPTDAPLGDWILYPLADE